MVLEIPKVVLDTNIVSYIVNGDTRAQFYESEISGMQPVISFQTWEEILIMTIKNGWGVRRRRDLLDHLSRYEVIWPTPTLVVICAELRAERETAGRRMEAADGWIAATAIMLGCPLATHDRDFIGIPNLQLITALDG